MTLLVWKRFFFGESKIRAEIWKFELEITYLYFTLSISSPCCMQSTGLSDIHCPFITVSDLVIDFSHIGFHHQVTPFYCKLFSLNKISIVFFSMVVWINNLPVDKPNLHRLILLCCSKETVQIADEDSLPKRPVTCIFFSVEQQSQFVKGTKKWVIYAAYHQRGAASDILCQVVLSKLDTQHRVNEAMKIMVQKWVISFDRHHQGLI